MTWTIKDRAISDGSPFYELTFDDESQARAKFAHMREHARVHGGSAALYRDGVMESSYSLWAESE